MSKPRGDYIHYHGYSYDKYGINRREEGSSVEANYGAIKQNILERTSALMTFDDKKAMEDNLSRLLKGEDLSERDKELVNWVQEEMKKQFGESLRYITNTGKVDKSKIVSSQKKDENLILSQITETNTYLNTITDRLKAIEQALSKVTNAKTAKEIRSQVNMAYRLLKGVVGVKYVSELKSGNLKNRLIRWSDESGGGKETILGHTDKNGNNVVSIINSLLKNADLFAAAGALQQGTFFEYLIAAVPGCIQSETGDALETYLPKGSVKGMEGTKMTIDFDKNNFTKGIDGTLLSTELRGLSANVSMVQTYHKTQGKLDVKVEWGNQTVPISAKNVNLKNSVHIVSGTNLLYLIQDEDLLFVNHYLNIIAEHKDGNNGSHFLSDGNIKAAHEAMKYIALFKALTGKTFGKEELSAEVFVINDNRTGTVRVIDMKDLLTKAYDNLNAYTSITANDQKLENMQINNEWSPNGYSSRITKFIANTIKQKLSVSLKPSIFSGMGASGQ